MSIHVQSGRGLRVSKNIGDRQKRNAMVEHNRCSDVTQVVKTDVLGLPVDILPLEREQLSLTHAGLDS